MNKQTNGVHGAAKNRRQITAAVVADVGYGGDDDTTSRMPRSLMKVLVVVVVLE